MTVTTTLRTAADSEPARRKAPGWVIACVALYAAGVFLPFLGARTLTPHEVMVSHPALRILEDGHWIVPRFASGFWLDKPPLVNWLTAACFAIVGGFSEFAARLPAALSAVGLCVLMAVLAGRFFSTRVALLTGLVQASCVYMYMQGRLGEIDIVLALLLTAAHGVLLWHWGRGGFDLPWRASLLFYFLAALGVLAKGPVAVALLGATVIAYAIWRRTWRPIRAVLISPGVLVFVLVAGGWHVAAAYSVGAEALQEWNYNTIARFLGLHRLGSQSFFLYFRDIPWMVLPWTVALVLGARVLAAGYRGPDGPVHRFLWSWFLGGLGFLLLALFKHKHYAIPILPPLSILAALVIDAHLVKKGVHARRFYTIVFAVCLLGFAFVGGYVMPRQDHRRVTAEFVAGATAGVPADETLYVIGLAQSSAYPYIAHKRCAYLDRLDDIRDELRERQRPMWVLSLRKYAQLAADRGLSFEQAAAEQPRRKHPEPETLVLGRLWESEPAASSPAGPR